MEKYESEGYLGCLLGGLGQELSGVSDAFRLKIDECFGVIAKRIAACLEEARVRGDLPPDSDPRRLADLLIDCWEGQRSEPGCGATPRHSSRCSTSTFGPPCRARDGLPFFPGD